MPIDQPLPRVSREQLRPQRISERQLPSRQDTERWAQAPNRHSVAAPSTLGLDIARLTETQLVDLQQRREDVKWTEQVEAAWDDISVMQRTIDLARRERFQRDPSFNYFEHREEIEGDLTYDENKHIRANARSLEHARALRAEALEGRERDFVLGARGMVPALTASLVAGFADPPSWAAGFGAGKVLQLGGVGSRALFAGGRTGAAVGSIAAESAIANVAIEAALDAAGRRTDTQDYAIAAAFGGVMGVAMSPIAFRGMAKEGADAAFRQIREQAEADRARMYERAVQDVGPNATPEAISRRVEEIQREQVRWMDEARLAMPEDGDRFLAVGARVTQGEPPAAGPVGVSPDAQLRAAEDAAALRAAQRADDAGLRAGEDTRAEAVESLRLRLNEDRRSLEVAQRNGDPDAELRAREDLAETEALYRQAIRESQVPRTEGAPSDAQLRAQEDLAESQAAARAGEETPFVATEEGPSPAPRPPEGPRAPTEYDREIGVDGMMQSDPIRAALVSEVHQRADAWVGRNPMDEQRLKDFLSRLGRLAPRLATTAQQLLRSNHPVARMIAGTLLENTTGAAGRRSTAALDKAMLERVYLGEIEKLPDLYRLWRQAEGGSALRDFASNAHLNRFGEALSEYRVRVQRGIDDPDVNPYIKQASIMLDRFYAQTRRDQVRAGTPGSENLPPKSDGYFSRRLKSSFVQNLTNSQRRALAAEYARQLRELWDGSEIADRVAAQIVDRARIAAAGGVDIPAHVYSSSATGMIRDALSGIRNANGEALSSTEVERMLRKINSRSPAFTKERLDLDVLAEIRDPETGESFRLLDVYETDQLKLALNYARRVSGEVALSKYGVPGEQGLEVLRDALSIGRDGQRLSGQAMDDAVQAFDQIAAEFLGRPFKLAKWTNAMDNLRMLTASSRLGGMAFTQFGEYANALPALGAVHTLAAVKAFPRMISEIRSGKANPILDTVQLVGGELGTDWKTNFPFQNLQDTFVHGQEAMSVFDKVVRTTSNIVPHINGWHYVHAAQVRGMAEQIIHRATKMVRDDNLTGDALRMMEDMGFSPEVRAAWKADLARVAKFDAKGNLIEFDVSQFSDPKIAHDIVQSINRGAKQIIQGSYIGEKGLWAHDGMLRILTQFRTFSLVSVEKQWTRVSAIRGGAKTFGFLLGAMSWAIPIHLARIQLNSLNRENRDEYIEQQLNPMMFARAIMNYSSLSGFASDMLDVGAATVGMAEGITGIDSGLDMTGVRGISDGDIGAIIPSLGYANSTLRAITKGQPENLLRSMPGGNIPWAVPLINAISAKGADPDWDFSDH